MRLPLQKALGWFALAIGGGGILLITWVLILEGLPDEHERFVWAWLAGTVVAAVLSLLVLKRAYRLAPAPRRLQMILADLMVAVTVFASVLLVGSHVAEENELFQYWFLPALVIAFCYLAGVTRGAQLGLHGWRRYPVAIATAVTVLGCLGLGAFLVHTSVLFCVAGKQTMIAIILDVFGSATSTFPAWLARTYRVCLCAVPIGLLLNAVAHRMVLGSSTEEADRKQKD